jgi:hypothetical protein
MSRAPSCCGTRPARSPAGGARRQAAERLLGFRADDVLGRPRSRSFFLEGNGQGADIQPDDLASFGVSLDIEVADSIPTAKPVSNSAREGTECALGSPVL